MTPERLLSIEEIVNSFAFGREERPYVIELLEEVKRLRAERAGLLRTMDAQMVVDERNSDEPPSELYFRLGKKL